MWLGVAQWFGVTEGKMGNVLPSAGRFNGLLFSQEELFNL